MKKLSEKEKSGLNKQLNVAVDVRLALEDDLPGDLQDCMCTLGGKDFIKDLKSCLKRGQVDGLAFLGALDSMVKEWKALDKIISKAIKDANKAVVNDVDLCLRRRYIRRRQMLAREEKIVKQLGND